MSKFSAEPIPNLLPYGHAPNALELAGGDMLVTWMCGSYEGSEDQRIVGALKKLDDHWQPTQVILDRFEYDGETWMPETSVPIPLPEGDIRLFFWAYPRSSMRIVQNPRTIRLEGGWGGGAWFPFHTLKFKEPIWTREIAASKVFYTRLRSDFKAETPQLFVEEQGLVLYGAAHKLKSGCWLLPYHTERASHSRFFISDKKQENWQTRGDIFAEPGCLEPVVVQLTTGEILCYMRRGGYYGHIWRAISSDEAQSFSKPVQTNLRNPHAGIDIGLSHISGALIVAYNDSYRQRTPLCVGISADGGKTFRMRDVESDPGHFGYPKLLQDNNGLWHLFYSYDVRYIQHAWFDEEWLEEGRQVLG